MWTWLSNPLCCSIGVKQQGSCHVHSFFATLQVLISRKTRKNDGILLDHWYQLERMSVLFSQLA